MVGSEVEVVPDMLLTGAFAHINYVMFDWTLKQKIGVHGWEERNKLLEKLKVQTI